MSPAHCEYLRRFSETRRVKRDPIALQKKSDPLRNAVDLPIGDAGGFYVSGVNTYPEYQDDDSIVDYNQPPAGQPGLWCQWAPNDTGEEITWDGGENFYNYVEWLEYFISHFISPWGYSLSGDVQWIGDDEYDTGWIIVKENDITILGSLLVTQEALKRPLSAFLCHAKDDKHSVRQLYDQLQRDGVEPWFDDECLLPGQDWEDEIRRAVASSDVIIVCLSSQSVDKVGFVQKEIRMALDVADLQPEGRIFIIPLRFETCDLPSRLRKWQRVDYYAADGYVKLRKALQQRVAEL